MTVLSTFLNCHFVSTLYIEKSKQVYPENSSSKKFGSDIEGKHTQREGKRGEREEERPGGMAGLQRSEISFRRQGSSGLVWEDRLISGELKKKEGEEKEVEEGGSEFRELRPSRSVGASGGGGGKTIERSRSNNGGRNYRTGKVTPSLDPPSPKVSGCGFCGVFGKPVSHDGRSKTKTKTKTSPGGKRKA